MGDRFGSRIMLFAAATLYLISMLLLSRISELWHFFLFFGVLLSLTQSLGMVPLMASVSGWFRRRLGSGNRNPVGRRRHRDCGLRALSRVSH